MTTFFIIAGVTVTILGILALSVISGIYIAVKFFGLSLTLGTIKEKKDEQQRNRGRHP